MQHLKHYYHLAERFTTTNSPALLTAVGVAGTVSTALLSGKAHVQATDIRRREQARYDGLVSRKDRLKAQTKDVWKVYVPPVTVATVTCTSIVFANRIGTRRTAALAAAYATSDKAFNEYREKVTELMGPKEETKVRDAVAQDQVTKNPPGTHIMPGEDQTLFYDARCGRYFLSTMETVKAAQNHVNYILNQEGDVSLNTFYSWLDLDTVPDGEELGWRFDKGAVDLIFTTTLANNNKPAIVMNFRTVPIRNYDCPH